MSDKSEVKPDLDGISSIDDDPLRIPSTDPLLAKLYREHPDRRYEALRLVSDKRLKPE